MIWQPIKFNYDKNSHKQCLVTKSYIERFNSDLLNENINYLNNEELFIIKSLYGVNTERLTLTALQEKIKNVRNILNKINSKINKDLRAHFIFKEEDLKEVSFEQRIIMLKIYEKLFSNEYYDHIKTDSLSLNLRIKRIQQLVKLMFDTTKLEDEDILAFELETIRKYFKLIEKVNPNLDIVKIDNVYEYIFKYITATTIVSVKYDNSINCLGLKKGTIKILNKNGIKTISSLKKYSLSGLIDIEGVGKNIAKEIELRLEMVKEKSI